MRATLATAAGFVAVASAQWTETSTVDVTVTSCSPEQTECAAVKWEDWSTVAAPATTSAAASSWSDWTTVTASPAKATSTEDIWSDWSSVTASPAMSTVTGSDIWSDWSSVTASPASASGSASWADWASGSTPVAVTSTGACPSYTATGPPEWFSWLPSDSQSSMAAKWSAGPPADWCQYTYSTGAPTATSTGTWATWSATTTAGAVGGSSSSQWADWSASATTPVLPQWTGAANANAGSFVVAGLAAAAALVIV